MTTLARRKQLFEHTIEYLATFTYRIESDDLKHLGLRIDVMYDFANNRNGFRIRSYSPFWNVDHIQDTEQSLHAVESDINAAIRKLAKEFYEEKQRRKT